MNEGHPPLRPEMREMVSMSEPRPHSPDSVDGRTTGADIGIVIPAYNAERFLPAALDSVRSQSFEHWTCIVVDDGSTDGTRGLAEEYAAADPRIRVLSVGNGGQARARNLGARALGASVSYLAFLDADDVWAPGALLSLLTMLQAAPAATAVAGLARDIDLDGNLTQENYRDALRHEVARSRRGVAGWRLARWRCDQPSGLATLAVWCHIETPGLVLMRRMAFDRTEAFRSGTSPSEDWDLWLQLARLGPILHLPEVVLDKRVVPGSESRQRLKMRRAEPNMRRLWAREADLSRDERHTLTVGHFYGCLQRFLWAWDEVCHGDFTHAFEHTRHGLFAFGRFALIQGLGRWESRPWRPEGAMCSPGPRE